MKIFAFMGLMALPILAFGQKNLEDLLKTHNKNLVPYITIEELVMPKTEAILLDARERDEYQVSHLKNAIYVGYNEFDISWIHDITDDKNQLIVVYCSLGIRSEIVANKVKEAGYNNVENLYGGIFEWKNKGFPVYDSDNKETDSVHAFSKIWGKWLKKGVKVYNRDLPPQDDGTQKNR